MIPEYGHLALIFSAFLALCLAIIPLVGTILGRVIWIGTARSLATGMFVFIGIAYGCLTWSFYVDDFSVAYVASNSNSLLPVYYKVCAVWGGHEGSLLLWAMILATWTFAVSQFSRNMPLDVLARVLSVMGMIAVGFLAFMLITSNPFARILPDVPLDGGDLNPLLQDFGFIIHPPMLYMGYVGFSVVFAFAIAALIGGRVDSAWARWARPWTNTAWSFLTVGIGLGSWWAYYELGWGGWWFWDPVENASFMPWLAGTALIHSLAMSEKRGVFNNWTLLLSISAFSLSLLGTFLVRSGVLTSVHAFASDPARGLFILIFLGFVVGGSLILYAVRAPALRSEAGFTLLSRESFLLANSFLFVISCGFVLLGTLFPLIADALSLGKFSVGEPYFNMFFPKLMAIVGLLMGTGMMLSWKKTNFTKIRRWQLIAFLFSLWVASFVPGIIPGKYSISAAIAIFVGSWVISTAIVDVYRRANNAKSVGAQLIKFGPSYYGMVIAHIGFGVSLLGVSIDSIYSDQRDIRLTKGSVVDISGYEFRLVDVTKVQGPNYEASRGSVIVTRDGELIAKMYPEKRQYSSGGNMMTEAAIDAGLFRDLYVSLGDQLNETDWAFRVYYKPLVRWIWLGALLMAFGGVVAITDKRYRRVSVRRDLPDGGDPLSVESQSAALEDASTQSNSKIVEGL